MREDYVGITLIFAFHSPNEVGGILRSYVLESTDKKAVYEEASKIVVKEYAYDKMRYDFRVEYIGVHDVFSVVGPLDNGALLGRMSALDLKLGEAMKLVCVPSEFDVYTRPNYLLSDWYLSVPVYYVEDYFTDGSAVTWSCYCLINTQEPSSVLDAATAIAKSASFKHKILKYESDVIELEMLTFLGFENIHSINNVELQANYFEVYNNNYDSMDKLFDLRITDEEWNGFFYEWDSDNIIYKLNEEL